MVNTKLILLLEHYKKSTFVNRKAGNNMTYKKIYTLYQATTGTPKERATVIYNIIHNNSEYGRFADCPIEWLEHKIETGEINTWK